MEHIEAVPPILSLLCRELNERWFTAPAGNTRAPAQQIMFSESDTDVKTIVKSFTSDVSLAGPTPSVFSLKRISSVIVGRVWRKMKKVF